MRRRPPRRLLGVLVAATAALTLSSSASTAGAADTATAATAPSAGTAAQPLPTSTPVVFVHGYTGSASNWVTAMSVFRLNGWSSSDLFAYEYDSYGNNVTDAQCLASMGGLVSQYCLKVSRSSASTVTETERMEVRRLHSLTYG
ncbi:hypothetical protein J7I94_27105 [Streptomyces sp. ISL-12]|nr:hypothetical protein [Streptomyces sp. ISL-12]